MTLVHGHIMGRQHRLIQHNGQDFAISGALNEGGCFGMVLDGCGSKWRMPGAEVVLSGNEVGARLLGTFAAATLPHLAHTTPLPDLPHALSLACLRYLQQVADAIPFADEQARHCFIHTHLLCTWLGFIRTDAAAILFWLGDGYLLHNDTVLPLESDNQPDYLAYRLLHQPVRPFINQLILPHPAELTCLAVATDGWRDDLLREVAAAPRTPLTLQRWLNQQAQQRGNFEDDGAIALWQKTPEP